MLRLNCLYLFLCQSLSEFSEPRLYKLNHLWLVVNHNSNSYNVGFNDLYDGCILLEGKTFSATSTLRYTIFFGDHRSYQHFFADH